MSRARTVCNRPGCPNLLPPGSRGRCPTCARTADAARGSSTARGYARTPGHRAFRAQVLARDVRCVMPDCSAPATVADHHPVDRRTLVARGQDPNDPRHGRGLCASHHGKATAEHQPGGFHARRGSSQ